VIEPAGLSAQVRLGEQYTTQLHVGNAGLAELSFQISEISGTLPAGALNADTIHVVNEQATASARRAGDGAAAERAVAERAEAGSTDTIPVDAAGSAPVDIGTSWETMAPLPAGRVFAAVIADTNGYVYVIGGASDAAASIPTTTTYRYDTVSNAWTTMAPLPVALYSIDGVVIDNRIYIPGDAGTATTYVYDIAMNTWSSITANGGYTARGQYQVVAIGADLYVLGGIVGGASTTQVWKLNTLTGAWSASAPMQKSRTSFSAVAVNGVIYVAGGVLFPGFTPDMTAEKFDGTSWSYIAGVPDGGGAYTRWSYNADALGADGVWLAAGRRDADWNVLNHAGVYNPNTNAWTTSPAIPAMAQGRVYCEGDVATDGYFYVIGGRDSLGGVLYATNERLRVGYAGLQTDVPWLSEAPVTGTVPADSARVVEVTFAAFPTLTASPEYPVFHATLVVRTTDSGAGQNGALRVPVTMAVYDLGDLGVRQSAVRKAGNITFTIVVSNTGPANGSGAVLTSTLQGVTVTGGSLCAIAACPGAMLMAAATSSTVLTATLDNLPAGAVVTHTLTGYAAPGPASNAVALAPPAGYVDVTPANNGIVSMTGARVMLPLARRP
jgi:uncharacterized repeat protein (TIGR01451 family)